MTSVRGNFLRDRQIYEFELPLGASRRPELTSVLKTAQGLREITYREHALGHGPAARDTIEHRFDITGPSGNVGIYSPVDGTPTLIALWELQRGTLQTFMDDQVACGTDLEQELTTVVRSLTISMTEADLPVVEPTGPVTWSNSRDQFHVESMFYPPVHGADWPAVMLAKEAPWAREGTALQRMTAAVRRASVTNVLQVTAHVAGPPARDSEIRRYAQRVAETMVPVP